MKAKFRRGCAITSVILALLISAGCAPGSETAALTVSNQTSEPICHVFIVPHTATDWGNDQLDGEPVVAGDTITFMEIEPGLYNLRAETCVREYFSERYDTELRGEVEWIVVEE